MLKRAFGVVGWVDEDAFDLPPVKRQQGLEGLQVVALNQQVISGSGGIAKDMARSMWAQNMGCGVCGHRKGGLAVKPVECGHGSGLGLNNVASFEVCQRMRP